MSNLITAMTKRTPAEGEYNPATLLPLALCCIFGAVLILYSIIGGGWLVWQWLKERQIGKIKMQKSREQGKRGDAMTNIPLEELSSTGRARGTEESPPTNWENCDITIVGGEIQGQASRERRPNFDLSDLVFDSPSPTPKDNDRTNVRRSTINPRTHATPEVDLTRTRTGLHKTQSASSNLRTQAISDTRSHADSSYFTSRTRTRSDAHMYPADSSSSNRTRAKSDPRIGQGISEVPPPVPGNRAKSTHRPSFAEHDPYPQPAFETSGKFARTMGTKTLDAKNWLTLDNQYAKYHKVRAQILDTHPNETIQILKGSEKACEELFYKVTSYLVEKYPKQFQLMERVRGSGEWAIHNLTTGEYFYTSPLDTRFSPLEICARLTQDDFNVLMQDPKASEHKLIASATLFPAAWKLRERIGYTTTQLHAPIPGWSTKLSPSVEKYLSRLHAPTPGVPPTYEFKERAAYFIQTLSPSIDILSQRSLFLQTPSAMCQVPGEGGLDKAWIIVRRERQTFIRLEQTGAVVFTVRTSMERLSSLSVEDLNGLRREVRAWPDDVAAYRCRDVWGDVLLRYCDEMCADVDE